MIYTSYEVFILTVLVGSLVVNIPVKLFNLVNLIFISILLVNFNLIGQDLTVWETLIKVICLIMGVIFINNNNSKSFTSSSILVLCVTLASMVMVSSTNLLTLYLALELQSLSVFILISRKREIITRVEASLKYFVLSSISSGLFLLGSSLIFVRTGSSELFAVYSSPYNLEKTLIVVSLLFKLAASPFHFWSPDVYQGSDNKALMVLGILPKISVFGIFVILLPNVKLLIGSTILSLVVGSVGAINQTDTKRLLAYSSVVAMGFILLGVSISTYEGVQAGFTYMVIYLLSFLGIILILENVTKENSKLIELSNLVGRKAPILGAFSILVLSIAGIPPLGGFLAKWFVLSSAIGSEFILSAILSIVCAMVAGVYYLRLIKISYFQQDKSFLIWRKILLKEPSIPYHQGAIIGMIVYSILFFLVSPQTINGVIHFGVLSTF
uniref:NADH:ubiquinone reductase (H(+)-translocating) n=1 Tax=Rhizostoma pulmo TaxID=269554 RepID=G9IT85_RHIPL|nr:NADH dehydrogenase subunit 2 [Rhizostoma pulmo]